MTICRPLAENHNVAENEMEEAAQQSIVNCTLETEIENLLAAVIFYNILLLDWNVP